MNGEWLTTTEVAKRWKVTTREVQRMASDGTLDHMRVGRTGRIIRIAESTVAAYERAHTHAGGLRR